MNKRIQLSEVNEAAAQLRRSLKFGPDDPWPVLDEALAIERRATVERIRERVAGTSLISLDRLLSILDEVAE